MLLSLPPSSGRSFRRVSLPIARRNHRETVGILQSKLLTSTPSSTDSAHRAGLHLTPNVDSCPTHQVVVPRSRLLTRTANLYLYGYVFGMR